jgi:beta-lactam-binding protein with PASTA domain
MDPESRIEERMVTMPNLEGLTTAVADQLLQEVGLPAVLLTNRPASPTPDDPRQLTANPELRDYYYAAPAAALPPPYVIYRQFPSAGSELEQGTQVMLRAR